MAERKEKSYSHPDRHYEVRDAMHTILRAAEHTRNKPLMREVRKHAAKHAGEMAEKSHQARQLAKAGRISDKALARLDKTATNAGARA